MSEAYDFIKAWSKPGEFAGWFDISIKPPIGVHILLNIKDWGCAIGRLSNESDCFIFSLPHEDSSTFLRLPVSHVSHWAVAPTIKDEDE